MSIFAQAGVPPTKEKDLSPIPPELALSRGSRAWSTAGEPAGASSLAESQVNSSNARKTARWLPFEVRGTHGPGWDRVTLEGELELATAPLLEDELDRLERHPAALLVMDLRQLSFMDLTGMHVLLAAHDRALLSGRRLAFVRGPSVVHRLFELVGVEHEVDLIADPTEAQLLAFESTSNARHQASLHG